MVRSTYHKISLSTVHDLKEFDVIHDAVRAWETAQLGADFLCGFGAAHAGEDVGGEEAGGRVVDFEWGSARFNGLPVVPVCHLGGYRLEQWSNVFWGSCVFYVSIADPVGY